jgi:hypothetical protein
MGSTNAQGAQGSVQHSVGTEGTAAARGDGGYVVQEQTGAGSFDPNAQVQGGVANKAVSGRVGMSEAQDGAVEQSGYEDPVMKTQATKERVAVQAGQVQGTTEEVQSAAADPQSAAMMAGQGQAASQVAGHTPESVVNARADVSAAGDVYSDPEAAGVGQARLRVEQKVAETGSDADAQGSVQANVGVSTSTDPAKK